MRWSLGAGVAVALAAGGAPAHADVSVNLEEAASGLTAPMMMVQPAGDDRRFIVRAERPGQDPDAGRRGPGRAVPRPHRQDHPAVAASSTRRACSGSRSTRTSPTTASSTSPTACRPTGRAISTSTSGGRTPTSSRSTRSPRTIPTWRTATTVRQISAIDWPQFNHNGHWIGFGPDGMLYISTGDGGYANDWGIGHNVTEGNGQDLLVAARQDPPDRRQRHVRAARTTASRPTIRSSARKARRCPRSGPTACATRGAARSTWAATTSCSAATCSRTATRRSASSRRAATTAGG